jgi:hypothetical protein
VRPHRQPLRRVPHSVLPVPSGWKCSANHSSARLSQRLCVALDLHPHVKV